jgi:hypothetical protein
MAARNVALRDLQIETPALGTALRMIVPGWAHWHVGLRGRARAFAGIWGACLLVGLLGFGSSIGAVALGAAFAVHAGSILDLLLQVEGAKVRSTVLVMMLTAALLAGAYVPLGRAALGIITARQLLETGEPLEPGDVVLFMPGAYNTRLPQPGEVVLYSNTPFRTTDPRAPGGRARQLSIRGEWVDRVVAGPGSTVKWIDGKLWVDGQESIYLPLNPNRISGPFEFTVPTDACCVFPTTNPYANAVGGTGYSTSAIVHQSQLVGRVVVRNYPFWRWWFLW